jgi:hypothetical protein
MAGILDPAEDTPHAPCTTTFPGETVRVLKERETREYGLLVLTTRDRTTDMQALARRLDQGSPHYPGAQQVFGGRMAIQHTLTCRSIEDYDEALREFVRSRARQDADVALVYLPRGSQGRDPQRRST